MRHTHHRRRPPAQPARPALVSLRAQVYLGGLNPAVHTEEAIKAAAAAYGAVTGIEMARRGTFGYVQFATDASADAAIAGLNGAEIAGSVIKAEAPQAPKARAEGARRPRRRAPRKAEA